MSVGSKPRTRGSVRFEAYYKVQWWNDSPRMLAWIDVQYQHATEEEARAAFIKGRRCRVMRVTQQGRAPLPEAVGA